MRIGKTDPTTLLFNTSTSGSIKIGNLMICWGQITVDYNTATTLRGTWSYPAAFASPPHVFMSTKTMNNSDLQGTLAPYFPSNPTTGSVNVWVRKQGNAAFGTSDQVTVSCLAIGECAP